MTEGKKDGRKKLVSRRDFLVAGGAVIAAGALSACTPKTETVTSTIAGTTKTVTVTNTVTNTVTSTATGTAATKTVTSTVTGTGVTSTVTAPGTTVTKTATPTATTAAKVVVFDPRGTPSPITLKPMAKRLDTLDGKTIYVVDIMYPYTQVFAEEVSKILQQKYPKTTWIYRQKYGTYSTDDPTTWDLIQAKGHGMVVLVGH
jgi:TAT (twin-arginine translocation) pathway signal sequence